MSKKIKIFLCVWSVIFLLAFLALFVLNKISSEKIYSAQITLIECEQNKETFICKSKINFNSSIFRYQKGISNIAIIEENYKIKDDLINTKHDGSKIYFETTRNLDSDLDSENLDSKNLGSISFKVTFTSAFQKLFGYFFGGIALCFFIVFIKFYKKSFFDSLPAKNIIQDSLILSKKDKIFLGVAGFICFGIFVFTFWLGFPGYHIIGDTYNSINLNKNNSHPVFIAYVVEVIYIIFGKHLFYLFLFNLIPFYLGIFILIAGFYLRFKSFFTLVLIFPTFIGNIYFQNFVQYHSFALPMLLFLLYSMLLFLILVPHFRFKKAFIIGIFVVAFFAILWRHNAIFSVFPIFFILCFLFLKDRGLAKKDFVKKYVFFVASSAILCLGVVIIVPHILKKGESFPSNHLFLHQIAGACVPNDDSSCFLDEWYYPHKNFADVKALYKKYPLNADPFNVAWGYDNERPFKHEKLNGLKRQWIKSILKYPRSFAEHELRFIKAMWIQEPSWMFDATRMQTKPSHPWHIKLVKGFPQNEQSVTFSPLQEQIYAALYNHRITLNHIVGVASCFIILLLSSVLLCFRRDSLLVFSFSVSFAGFFSALIISLFTPVPETRYMSPILPMAILSVVGFVAFGINFFRDRFSNLRI